MKILISLILKICWKIILWNLPINLHRGGFLVFTFEYQFLLPNSYIFYSRNFRSQCDEDEGDDDILSDSGSGFTDEMGDEIGSLNEFEKKSVFTDYSMSSSVISRNSQLTLLDETFEQVRIYRIEVNARIALT